MKRFSHKQHYTAQAQEHGTWRWTFCPFQRTERQRFVDAIVKLNQHCYPGSKTDFPAGGVSYWFKMDEIHQATHVHAGPAFLPGHCELCNYCGSAAADDPDLSLHY
jgi:hypothetical protein